MITDEIVCESTIEMKIEHSCEIDEHQKKEFLNLLSYFTPAEIEELKQIL